MSDGTFLPRGATPWSAYNTPRIWAMVANEDDPESWRQVAALGSLAGLLKDQRARLELAKQQLIDAWPPERNKASAAFVELIDNLLLTMRKNKEIADANAGALSQILEALRRAKRDVQPLYQQYLQKSDDWVPGWWDNAEDELDEQARARMRDAEDVIAHPDNAIRSPGLYEFAPGTLVSEPIRTGDGSGRGGTVSAPGAGAADGFPVPHDPPPVLPGADALPSSPGGPAAALQPGAIAGGPDLAGVITPVSGSVPTATPVAPPAPVGSPIAQPVPGLVIGGGLPVSGGRAGRGGVAPPGLPGPVRDGRGGLPTAKPVPPSWLPPAPGAQGRSGGPSVLPSAGGRRPQEDREHGPTFDPDSLWVTAEGVPPVIEPSRRRHRHDPGPGVIGWHG